MSKILFLDESGDHSLSRIDPQYPVFTLCGIIMDDEHHENVATPHLNELKTRLFGRTDIVLHTADFTRNKLGFEAMASHEFRSQFFAEVDALIAGLDFRIVACVIKKDDHLAKYRLNALDPYLLALSLLVERFIFDCGSAGGTIIAEGRSPTLDNALELAFLDLKIRGTDYVSASKVKTRIRSLLVRQKSENIAGLQIADLAATPIGRRVLGRPTYPQYSRGGDFFTTLQGKFRQDGSGKIEGMGLVVLPK